jgi:hypothetical protein
LSENGRQNIIDKVRWMTRRGHVLEDVRVELLDQDRVHGENRQVQDGEWFKWIIEEVGEASRGSQEGDRDNLRTELIQAAALCIQFASMIVVDHESKTSSPSSVPETEA